MARVTGSVTIDKRNPERHVFYLLARDRANKQRRKRLGPVHAGRGKPAPGYWSEQDAEDALREWLVDLGRAPTGPKMSATFGDAVRAWLHYLEHDRGRRPSHLRDCRGAATKHLIPELGASPIGDITPEDIDRWRERLVAEGRLSPRTINKLLTHAHGVFERARRLYGLSANPVAVAERQPVHHHGDITVIDPQDVLLLASKATSEQDAALYTVAAFTGLRMGEVLALRWRDVDFAKRLVHVRWSFVEAREDRPKSHKVRSVPLIDQAAAALDELSRRERFTDPGDLVFVNSVGRHLDSAKLRRRFQTARKAAGIGPARFHDLRHTFGTLAVQAFPLTDVKAYMGHADIQTTMIYVHHVPQHDAADKLSRLVASRNDPRNELPEPEGSERT